MAGAGAHVEIYEAALTAAAPQALHSLKLAVGDFTGRVEKLKTLRAKVESGSVAITGLQGMGGAGKTELARKLANELKPKYPDAQIEFDLKGVGKDPLSPGAVLENIIHAFVPDAKLPEDVDQLANLVRQVLDAKKVLLFLDNAKDAAQIGLAVQAAQGCCVIVTSRNHFHIAGMEAVDLGKMEPDEARAMLKKVAARGKDLPDECADRLAEKLDYLPLALRLAGSFLNVFHEKMPADYLRELEAARLGAAASGRRGRRDAAPPGVLAKLDHCGELAGVPEGLRASFAASYDRLKPELQTLFAQLFVFPDHFDATAVRAVWGVDEETAEDALLMLKKLSLLEWLEKERRYDLHDLLTEFAASLIADDEREKVVTRYAEHFTKVGSLADQLYMKGGENVVKGLALFDRERRHIENAFGLLNAVVAGVGDPGSSNVEAQESRDQRSRLQQAAARQLITLVDAVVYVGDLRFPVEKQRIPWLEAQAEAARIAKNRAGEGKALGNLGVAYKNLGETRKAIGFYEQALVIDREIGDRRGEGTDLGNLGNAYAALGETRKAIGFYEQQLVIAREIGDRRGEGNALGNLGVAYKNLGETRKAIGFYEQALVIDREIGDRRGEGTDLGNLGNAYAALGETRKAIGFYEQQLVIAREIGDRRGEGIAHWNSALALEKLGEKAEAVRRAEEALRIYEEIEDPNAAKVRGWIAKRRG